MIQCNAMAVARRLRLTMTSGCHLTTAELNVTPRKPTFTHSRLYALRISSRTRSKTYSSMHTRLCTLIESSERLQTHLRTRGANTKMTLDKVDVVLEEQDVCSLAYAVVILQLSLVRCRWSSHAVLAHFVACGSCSQGRRLHFVVNCRE